MSAPACDRENAARRAARTGLWTDDLREHTAACEICREVVLVTAFLTGVAEASGSEAETPLPDPKAIWLKARVGGSAALRDALRPIEIAEKAAWGAAAIAAVAGVVWLGPGLVQWISGWRSAASLVMSVPAASWLSAPVLLACGVGVVLTSALLTVFVEWASD